MEQEIAAVPEIACVYILRGCDCIRLFDEGIDSTNGRAVKLRTRTNVAVAGDAVCGLDAKGDDPALACGGGGLPAGFAEFRRLADDMVGSEHQNQCIAVTLNGQCCGNRDG